MDTSPSSPIDNAHRLESNHGSPQLALSVCIGVISASQREEGPFPVCAGKSIASILEIGIRSGDRLKRLLSSLHESRWRRPDSLRLGVDPFESAPQGNRTSTSSKHIAWLELGVKALIPGILGSPSRVANTVLPSDLVIVDGSFGHDSDTGRAIATWLPASAIPTR